MTNEVQRAIDDELPADAAPVSIDAETVMRASRRARQRRMGYQASGTVVSVLVAVAMVVTLTPLSGSDEPQPDGAAQGDRSLDADDPVVDPDKEYFWNGGYPAKETESAAAYTAAFWEHFTEEYPDATLMADDAQGSRERYSGDPDERAFFMAGQDTLYEGEMKDLPEGEPVTQRTILDMYERVEPGEGSDGTSCCGIAVQFEGAEGPVNRMDLQMFPEGTYTKRTGDIMDPAYCGPDDSCDINDVTGPDREDMQYVEVSTPDDIDGTSHTHTRYAVIYREDGSAVRVAASSDSDGSENVSDTLSYQDLRDIGLALPGDKVE